MPKFFLVILLFALLSVNLHAHKKSVAIAVIGAHASGKTALIRRYVENRYRPQETTFVGVDLYFAKKAFGDDIVAISILESPGISRFLDIFLPMLTRVDGILYVYDSTDADSIEGLGGIIKKIPKSIGERKPPVILVATKSDRGDKIVTIGQDLAREIDAEFFEVSALTDNKVNESFDALITQILSVKKEEADSELGDRMHNVENQDCLSTVDLNTNTKHRPSSSQFRNVKTAVGSPFSNGQFSIN